MAAVTGPVAAGKRPITFATPRNERSPDASQALFPLTLLILVCLAVWQLLGSGTVLGMDTATAFYPWFGYLGQNLRSGHLPLWNPHQFGGTPFLADPESGWAYLPAMLFFTALPLDSAANVYIFAHVALAVCATYGLARALGMRQVGAFTSAFAYGFSGFFFGHNVCCFAYASVAAWLPVALLGIELAVRASSMRTHVAWLALAGVGLSQIFAAWLGQGAYYSLLYVAAYLAYRSVGSTRLAGLVRDGAIVVGAGFGLAAIGVLPRIEYNALSNLPGGYGAAGLSSPTAALWDWGIIEDWPERLLTPGFHYAGVSTMALALCAPFVARGRYSVPFFSMMSAVILVLARWQPTPLHVALSTLPGFGPMHAHAPERILLVWFVGIALLAGSTIDRVAAHGKFGRTGAAVLALIVLVDLRGSWDIQVRDAFQTTGAYRFERVNVLDYYGPSAATEFLQQATNGTHSRAVGFAQHVSGVPIPYTLRWTDPHISALGVNNRAMVAGLYDIQGYNPIHLARYDVLMDALNGQHQDYHQTDVYESGLSSRLLDLLGVRFVVVPAQRAPDEAQAALPVYFSKLYSDPDVDIFENPRALPRAWVVRAAVRMDAQQALDALTSGRVDARQTVVLDEPPSMPDAESAHAAAVITREDADSLTIDVESDSPGWLVVSAAYDPTWQAHVDGQPAHVVLADGALRALVVPAGRHTVAFGYASLGLTLGALISAVSASVILVIVVSCGARLRR